MSATSLSRTDSRLAGLCKTLSSPWMEPKAGTEVKASIEWKAVVEGRVQSEKEGRNSVEVDGRPSERLNMDGVGGRGIAGGGDRGANDVREDMTDTTLDGGRTATTGWREANGSNDVNRGEGGPSTARKPDEASVMLAVRAVWVDEANDHGEIGRGRSSSAGDESHEVGEPVRAGSGVASYSGERVRALLGVFGREVVILAAEFRAEVGVSDRSKGGREAFDPEGDSSLDGRTAHGQLDATGEGGS